MAGCCDFGTGRGMHGTCCENCAARLEDFARWLRMAKAGRLAVFGPRVPPIPEKGGG